MNENIFLPRLKNLNRDKLGDWLRSVAMNLSLLVFGFLPIFFIPNIFTTLNLTKTFFVIVGVFLVVFILSLSILRKGVINIALPSALLLFWGFIISILVSALLSGDRIDALIGNAFEVQTAGFFVLLGIVMILGLIIGNNISNVIKFLFISTFSVVVLFLFHILRLFLGADFLSLGIFTNSTTSLIGSFNDLALFCGLVIIVTLLLMANLKLKFVGQAFSSFVLLGAVLLLAIINFSIVWKIIGLISLLILFYLLSKDTWLKSDSEENIPTTKFTFGAVGLVVLISLSFVVGGNYLGSVLSNTIGVTYLEVRPSNGATIDIIKNIYSENILFGVGTNRFDDAWRIYKDPIINQSNFWNTDFNAGSGLFLTLFATTGLVGGILLVLFLLAFIYSGYRTLFFANLDRDLYLVGIITFVSAFYLWAMFILYVPGPVIMFFTVLLTGIALAVYSTTIYCKKIIFDVVNNRHLGVFLIAIVLVIIILSTLAIIGLGKQYLSQINYNKTINAYISGSSLSEIDGMLQDSEQLHPQDIFSAERARLRLLELNRLLTIVEPTVSDEQAFQSVLTEGIALAEKAIALDNTNPQNYILLANFYSLVNPNQSEEIKIRIKEAFNKARKFDPQNPSYLVLLAQINFRHGDLGKARELLNEAIAMKGDYTEALYLLSQLDINEGKTDSALSITKTLISIESNNPARYFQLGVLLVTSNHLEEATEAFEQAVNLDKDYANARYFLALTYLDLGRKEEALVQLKVVENNNPNNKEIKDLISLVESDQFDSKSNTDFSIPISEEEIIEKQDDVVVSDRVPNTDLIKPLNQTGESVDNTPVVPEGNSKTTDSTPAEVSE